MLKLTKIREALASYALNYESDESSSSEISYQINKDPLWGMIEKKVGNGFSPLAWGSEFTQEDVNYNRIYYHYYGGEQTDLVDHLGFKVTDKAGNSLTDQLEMEIKISSDEIGGAYQEYSDSNVRINILWYI